jgi:hypothetical protein
VRIAIVVSVWLVYLVIGCAYRKPDDTYKQTSTEQVAETKQEDTSSASTTPDRGGYANIDAFIKRFNETSGLTIDDVIEVDNIADKDSDYYRVEYRTTPYQQHAVGAIGQIEGYGQIDMVSYGSFGFTDFRVYVDVPDQASAGDMFEMIGHVMVEDKYQQAVGEAAAQIRAHGSSSNAYIGSGYSACYVYDEVMLDGDADNIH